VSLGDSTAYNLFLGYNGIHAPDDPAYEGLQVLNLFDAILDVSLEGLVRWLFLDLSTQAAYALWEHGSIPDLMFIFYNLQTTFLYNTLLLARFIPLK
jgi:hypothetical protein